MNILKLRRLLISLHLYMAALLTPMFLMVAVSGALYIAGVEASAERSPVALPEGVDLDPESPTIRDDVQAVLKAQGINIKVEYIRGRGNTLQTRPTSRTHIVFNKTPEGWTAEKVKPGFQYALMEMHKGHGPRILRIYSMIAGIILFLVVVGGAAVGLLAPAYRRTTLISTAIGFGAFVLLAFIL